MTVGEWRNNYRLYLVLVYMKGGGQTRVSRWGGQVTGSSGNMDNGHMECGCATTMAMWVGGNTYYGKLFPA